MVTDESWKEVAEKSRECLALMGYPIASKCLPGEPDSCGGSYAQHAMAHMASLKAVCDHQIAHLGMPISAISSAVYDRTAEQLDTGCATGAHIHGRSFQQ